jgi:hypothetical protein
MRRGAAVGLCFAAARASPCFCAWRSETGVAKRDAAHDVCSSRMSRAFASIRSVRCRKQNAVTARMTIHSHIAHTYVSRNICASSYFYICSMIICA